MLTAFTFDEALYILKHQDSDVACMFFNIATGAVTTVSEVLDESLLPVGYKGTTGSLAVWWSHRAIPTTREKKEELQEQLGHEPFEKYLLKSLGLSLSDTYWVCPIDKSSSLKWSDVNFFQNSFNEKCSSALTGAHPGYSTGGDMQKTWLTDNSNNRVLVKTSDKWNHQQCINEFIVSEIWKEFSLEHTEYWVENKDCYCKVFTDERTDLVTAMQLMFTSTKRNHESYLDYLCRVSGTTEREYLETILLLDFVVLNKDRHFNNVGFLLNDDGVRVAPNFDNGNSLNYDNDFQSLWSLRADHFNKWYLTQLKCIKTARADLVKAMNLSSLVGDYLLTFGISSEKVDNIIKAYKERVNLLRLFYSEKRVWKNQKFWR